MTAPSYCGILYSSYKKTEFSLHNKVIFVLMKDALVVHLNEKKKKRHIPNYVMKYIFLHTYACEGRESLKIYIPN